MLSLAASKSKKPSAQPPNPNIRLGFGEAAARRSFFFACGILANVYFWPRPCENSTQPNQISFSPGLGPLRQFAMTVAFGGKCCKTLVETAVGP